MTAPGTPDPLDEDAYAVAEHLPASGFTRATFLAVAQRRGLLQDEAQRAFDALVDRGQIQRRDENWFALAVDAQTAREADTPSDRSG